jgi:hypothetical protein
MKLGIMQPYFLPYIGYFQAINEVDKYILYPNLTFIKDGWMNRNRIWIKNSGISTISIPLINKSSNTTINEVRLDNTLLWKKKLFKTIFLNYKGSIYFDEVFPLFENLFSESFEYLNELNSYLIVKLSSFIGIDTEIEYGNYEKYIQLEKELIEVENGDYSKFLFLEQTRPIKKVARVLTISKNEKADIFVNAIGGQTLYSKEEFLQYNIDLKFIQTNELSYSQFSPSFTPNLSIIDVLMHNGKNGTFDILNNYELI